MKKWLPLFVAGLMSGSALVFAEGSMASTSTTPSMSQTESKPGAKADHAKKHKKKHGAAPASTAR